VRDRYYAVRAAEHGLLHLQAMLLPRQQTEYPTRDLVAEERLHGRREGTFLVLAAMFLVASAALVLLGTGRIIDLSALITAVIPGAELPIALLLPLAVIPFGLGIVAIALVCELFGRRRATALVWAGVLGCAMAIGIAALTDQVDPSAQSLPSSAALASCYLTTNVAFVLVFDVLRRSLRGRHMWARLDLSTVIATGIGFGAFALALLGLGLADRPHVIALSVGSIAVVVASVVALTLPAALVARSLSIYLRVARHEADEDDYIDLRPRKRLPQATIVAEHADDDDDQEEQPIIPPRRRAARNSLQPYSSAEMRFFTEGDQLAEGTDA